MRSGARRRSAPTSYGPAVLRCVGEARPGRRFAVGSGPGEAVEITTGSRPAGRGRHGRQGGIDPSRGRLGVGLRGDADRPARRASRRGRRRRGPSCSPAGRVLRPQDLGVLSAVAARSIAVIRRPRVEVIVTGDELLPPGSPAAEYRLADMNSVMLAALIARDGGVRRILGPLPDDRDGSARRSARAAEAADAVLDLRGQLDRARGPRPGARRRAGRAAGARRRAPAGQPDRAGVPRRGPGRAPAGESRSVASAPTTSSPGRSSAASAAGRPGWPYRAVAPPLARKLSSVVGRVDYARVRIERGLVEPLAVSGASILSSTTRADGFVDRPRRPRRISRRRARSTSPL